MDALSDVLRAVRLTGAIFFDIKAAEPWLAETPAGEAIVGDIILLPHGHTHVLSSAPGLRKAPDLAMYRRPEDGHLPFSITMGDAQGAPAQFVCGFLGCDARPYNPLLAALPRVIRVSDRADSVAVVANRVGYESEAAFSRAFKKLVGAAPSQWRLRRAAQRP